MPAIAEIAPGKISVRVSPCLGHGMIAGKFAHRMFGRASMGGELAAEDSQQGRGAILAVDLEGIIARQR